jgi:hypothetical protein
MNSSRFLLRWIAILAVAILVASGCYLFRTRTIENPELGRITLKWRWGRAAEIAVDSNQDGKVDFRMLYRRWATDFRTHEPFDEAWESSRCDGRFDRHTRVAVGVVAELQYDSDGDGTLDRTLVSKAAEQYLRDNPRAPECGWGPDLRTPAIAASR